MLKFSLTIANQVRFLLQSLNEANANSVIHQLSQFIELGTDGSILLLQTCLDHLNKHWISSKRELLVRVVASIIKCLLHRPNFNTVFCEPLRNSEINEEILEIILNAFDLSVPEKISIGLALSDSENSEQRICGQNFCMAQIEVLCANPVPLNLSSQVLSIVSFLQQSEGLSKHVDSFMHMLSFKQPEDLSSFVLTPLLSDEQRDANFLCNMDLLHDSGNNEFDSLLAEMNKEMRMDDILRELGYGCAVDPSYCKEILSLYLPLTDLTIAKILGTIASTHAGLEDNQNTFSTFGMALDFDTLSDWPLLNSWNIDILVDTIKQLAPSTNWLRVIENLDHEGFYIPNQEAFSLFMSIYKRVCQEPFPLHVICGSVWKNMDAQLSFLKYAVSAPPEIFSFAHSDCIDAVHGHKLEVGHANHTWLCLDLLDVLCKLAETGQAFSVRSMLEYPLQHCPEILLLGMAHINTAYNLLQHEVSLTVFPMILENSAGNGMFFHLWNINPNLVLLESIEAHRSDSKSIIKILDIFQELKILSSVLDTVPFSFSIVLATLASKKALIDLEEWLGSNLSTFKDVFFEEFLKFLKEIQYGGSQYFLTNSFQYSADISNLYVDATPTFSKVLKAHIQLFSSIPLSEDMKRLRDTIMDSDPRLQNDGTADSSTHRYADDIVSEANSYFHQLSSGQLTIDAMVQMLSQFKESSLQREISIFDCMMADLLNQYSSEFSEIELNIAASLFGSVIKYQLLTRPLLDIFLGIVLNALRKPTDSEMFLFGTKALEQFVDRLNLWPMYCKDILEISHLRSTHLELVTSIEHAFEITKWPYSSKVWKKLRSLFPR